MFTSSNVVKEYQKNVYEKMKKIQKKYLHERDTKKPFTKKMKKYEKNICTRTEASAKEKIKECQKTGFFLKGKKQYKKIPAREQRPQQL